MTLISPSPESEKWSLKTILCRFQSYRHFPVTLGTLWLFTLILIGAANIADSEISDNSIYILLFIFLYGSGSFPLEAYFLKKKRCFNYYLLLALNTLLPAFMTLLLVYEDKGQSETNLTDTFFTRYCPSYFFILFFIAIYFCHKRLACSLEEYLTRIFSRAIRYHIFYFVLLIGSSIITSILSQLFNLDFNIVISTQMLLFGLYYMSSFLLALYPETPDDNMITSALIRYILPVITIFTYVVIYAYLLKILILRDIPSNAIFRIAAGLFVMAFPVCIMNSFYRNKNPLLRITRWLPCLFLPFLPLQGYSIGVRIYENGLTPVRCIAVIFLLFECLVLFLYHRKRHALHLLFLVMPVFFLVFGCMPYVNVSYLSYLSQKKTAEHYLYLPEAEQQEILAGTETYLDVHERTYGAYYYLKYDYYGSQYLESLPKSSQDRLALFGNRNIISSTVIYSASTEDSPFDVSGFHYCSHFRISEYGRAVTDENGELSYDLENYAILPVDKPQFTVNLSEILEHYRKQADENDEIYDYFINNNRYQIDASHTLVFHKLRFEYDKQDDTIFYFHIEGYLLEK